MKPMTTVWIFSWLFVINKAFSNATIKKCNTDICEPMQRLNRDSNVSGSPLPLLFSLARIPFTPSEM